MLRLLDITFGSSFNRIADEWEHIWRLPINVKPLALKEGFSTGRALPGIWIKLQYFNLGWSYFHKHAESINIQHHIFR